MLIQVPVLTCKPLCILSSRKPPKYRIRVLFNKQPELPDACPDLNLSIFLRFNHSLYMPITHIFLFQVNKESELMWKYFIYFWVMLRTGTFKVVLQMTTRLNSFKGPDRLWLLSSTSVSRRKTWQNNVKQKLSHVYVQNYIEKCVLGENVVLFFTIYFFFFYTSFSFGSKNKLFFRPILWFCALPQLCQVLRQGNTIPVFSLSAVRQSMDVMLQVLQQQACRKIKKTHSKSIIFPIGSVLKLT